MLSVSGRHMQKDDVVEVLSGKMIAVQPWRLSHALDNGSTVSRAGFFGCACRPPYFRRADAELSRHHLTAEERRFVQPGGGKSSRFGDRGPK
jgi:hypothetical protein